MIIFSHAINSFLRTIGGVLGVLTCQTTLQSYMSSHTGLPVELLIRDYILLLPNSSEVFMEYCKAIDIVFYILCPIGGVGLMLAIAMKRVMLAPPPEPGAAAPSQNPEPVLAE